MVPKFRFLLVAGGLAGSLLCAWGAGEANQHNFNDSPAGQGPTGLDEEGPGRPEGIVQVVDATSHPADPFGGEGNRSLMIEKDSDRAASVCLRAEEGFRKGKVSFRFCHDLTGQYPPTRAFVTLQGRGEAAILLQCSAGKLSYIDGDNRAQIFGQDLSIREANAITVEFDLDAGTFSGSLNGMPLTIGGETKFPVRGTPAEINEVLLRVGTSGGPTGRAFFDDIAFSGEMAATAVAAPRGPLVELDVRLPEDPKDLAVGDQRPARVFLDFKKILGANERPDLSTLRIVAVDAAGQEIPGAKFAYGEGADLPIRWDDAAIPYEFPEVDHLDVKTGELKREIFERLGASYNITGEGKAGWLTWTHTKPKGGIVPRYRISFSLLPEGSTRPGAPPKAWIGDGVPRFTKSPPSIMGSGHTRLAVTDWNGDGLNDLVLGENYGHILVMLNRGTKTAPLFEDQKLVFDRDGAPVDAGITASPHVTDWDGDGKEDLLVGTHWNRLLFFRNTGDNIERKLEYQGMVKVGDEPLEVPFEPVVGRPAGAFTRDYYPVVETFDWDADGDLDLLVGGYVTGQIFLFENVGRSDRGEPILESRGPIMIDGKPLNVRDWAAAPAVGDLNGDGLPDLVSGWFAMSPESRKAGGTLRYYVNTGTPGAPKFSEQTLPVQGFPSAGLHSPRIKDFNGDGLPDIAVSAGSDLFLLENVGTAKEPSFRVNRSAFVKSWGNTPLNVAQFADWNKDGLMDFVTDDYTVLINDGRGDPYFHSETVAILPPGQRIAHPSGIGDDWYFPRIYDFDGDGDADVLFGDWCGQVWYHENRGASGFDLEGKLLTLESGQPIKVGPIGLDPDTSFRALQGARTVLTMADYNGDGRNDLVLGDTYGVVRLFLNVGEVGHPKFREAEIIGDLKQRLSVDTVDWNQDGHPDIIAGSANGNVRLFLNSGKNQERDLFEEGSTLDIPKIIQPRVTAVDLNGDGDTDLFFPSTRGSILVERSFLEHGYAEAKSVTRLPEKLLRRQEILFLEFGGEVSAHGGKPKLARLLLEEKRIRDITALSLRSRGDDLGFAPGLSLIRGERHR